MNLQSQALLAVKIFQTEPCTGIRPQNSELFHSYFIGNFKYRQQKSWSNMT